MILHVRDSFGFQRLPLHSILPLPPTLLMPLTQHLLIPLLHIITILCRLHHPLLLFLHRHLHLLIYLLHSKKLQILLLLHVLLDNDFCFVWVVLGGGFTTSFELCMLRLRWMFTMSRLCLSQSLINLILFRIQNLLLLVKITDKIPPIRRRQQPQYKIHRIQQIQLDMRVFQTVDLRGNRLFIFVYVLVGAITTAESF